MDITHLVVNTQNMVHNKPDLWIMYIRYLNSRPDTPTYVWLYSNNHWYVWWFVLHYIDLYTFTCNDELVFSQYMWAIYVMSVNLMCVSFYDQMYWAHPIIRETGVTTSITQRKSSVFNNHHCSLPCDDWLKPACDVQNACLVGSSLGFQLYVKSLYLCFVSPFKLHWASELYFYLFMTAGCFSFF